METLTKQMGRRIMYSSIGNAWVAWGELVEARTSALAHLRKVANKLQSPDLASAFELWAYDCEEERRATELARVEKEAKSVEAELRRARFENDQMQMVRAKNEDEIKYLKDKVSDLAVELKGQNSAFEANAKVASELTAMRTAHSAALEAAEEAERRRVDAEEDITRQRRDNQRLLEKLLAEQRAGFVEEVKSMRRMREKAGEAKEASLRDVKDAREEVNAIKATLREKERELTKARDEAEGWVKVADEKEASASRFHAEALRLQEELNSSRDENAKMEEKLHSLRNHYLKEQQAPKPEPVVVPEMEMPPPDESPEPKKKSPKARREPTSGVLGHIDLEEGEDAPPVKEQLANALAKSSARVLDLFREWDKNGDGEVHN